MINSIEIINLSKSYGLKQAVKNLNFKEKKFYSDSELKKYLSENWEK